LNKGVEKGSFSHDEALRRFSEWKSARDRKWFHQGESSEIKLTIISYENTQYVAFNDKTMKTRDSLNVPFNLEVTAKLKTDEMNLQKDRVYDLELGFVLFDPINRKSIEENLAVAISPDNSNVIGNSFKKIHFVDKIAHTDFKIKPILPGGADIRINILQDMGLINSFNVPIFVK